MEWIKGLAGVFSGACVMAGAMELLCDGALKKSVSFILSLILLLSVVGAVGGKRLRLELDYGGYESAESGVELEVSEYQAEYICRSLLNDKGITFEKIGVKANKTDDGGIIISEIKIKGSDRGEEAVSEILKSGICDTVTLE